MYASDQGAPAASTRHMLKVENQYFDASQQLPTNTVQLMPQKLQRRDKGGDKSVVHPKGNGKGQAMMTRPPF